MARKRKGVKPLPYRQGLNAVRVGLPHTVEAESLYSYLVERFPQDAGFFKEQFLRGEIVDELGRPFAIDSPYLPGRQLFTYRPLPDEPEVPFPIETIYEDEDLLVVDKPHFLATMPRGSYITQTALIQLRLKTGNFDLSPAHRLDRPTAGVLLFTKRQELRRHYHDIFGKETTQKTYLAVAGVDRSLAFPLEIKNRIQKERGIMQAEIVPGEVNAISNIQLEELKPAGAELEVGSEIGLYRLTPRTGKTHQLRLHMNSIGLPILNDNYYPTVRYLSATDYQNPLQLLAAELSFIDPFTEERVTFRSNRTLDCWADLG